MTLVSNVIPAIYGQVPGKKSFKNEADVESEKEKNKNKGRNEGLMPKNK